MGTIERIRAVDVKLRVFPAPRPRYDARPPAWLLIMRFLAPFFSTFTATFALHSSGLVEVTLWTILGLGALVLLVATALWDRKHRVHRN